MPGARDQGPGAMCQSQGTGQDAGEETGLARGPRTRDKDPESPGTGDTVPGSPKTWDRSPMSPGIGVGTRGARGQGTGARGVREPGIRLPGSLGTKDGDPGRQRSWEQETGTGSPRTGDRVAEREHGARGCLNCFTYGIR